jgi:hypothetical protein
MGKPAPQKRLNKDEGNTEFDFWLEQWQEEIEERQRKINFVKSIKPDSLVLLSLHIDWADTSTHQARKVLLSLYMDGVDRRKLKKDFKCVIFAEAVHDTQLIGEPVAVEINVNMKVYRWKDITDLKSFPKEDLPLLLGYEKIYPLYDELLKGK